MCNVTGSAELAAVGVSVSVFNLVSKLFNVPLLNVTTSFVAEEQAIAAKDDNDSIETSILLSLKLIMKNVFIVFFKDCFFTLNLLFICWC
jgi:hypothetical protein